MTIRTPNGWLACINPSQPIPFKEIGPAHENYLDVHFADTKESELKSWRLQKNRQRRNKARKDAEELLLQFFSQNEMEDFCTLPLHTHNQALWREIRAKYPPDRVDEPNIINARYEQEKKEDPTHGVTTVFLAHKQQGKQLRGYIRKGSIIEIWEPSTRSLVMRYFPWRKKGCDTIISVCIDGVDLEQESHGGIQLKVCMRFWSPSQSNKNAILHAFDGLDRMFRGKVMWDADLLAMTQDICWKSGYPQFRDYVQEQMLPFSLAFIHRLGEEMDLTDQEQEAVAKHWEERERCGYDLELPSTTLSFASISEQAGVKHWFLEKTEGNYTNPIVERLKRYQKLVNVGSLNAIAGMAMQTCRYLGGEDDNWAKILPLAQSYETRLR